MLLLLLKLQLQTLSKLVTFASTNIPSLFNSLLSCSYLSLLIQPLLLFLMLRKLPILIDILFLFLLLARIVSRLVSPEAIVLIDIFRIGFV